MRQIVHQRLDVYRFALRVRRVVARDTAGAPGHLRLQMERAADSVLLNIAEGIGRRSKGEKRQFYAIARGSASELSAAFDVLLVCRQIEPRQYEQVQSLILRVIKMLTRMILNRS